MRIALLVSLVSTGCGATSVDGGVARTLAGRVHDNEVWHLGVESIEPTRPSGDAFGGYVRTVLTAGNGPDLGDGEMPTWFEGGGKVRHYFFDGVVRPFAEAELGTGVYMTYEVHGPAFALRGGAGVEVAKGPVGARIGIRAGGERLYGRGEPLDIVEAGLFVGLVYRDDP